MIKRHDNLFLHDDDDDDAPHTTSTCRGWSGLRLEGMLVYMYMRVTSSRVRKLKTMAAVHDLSYVTQPQYH